MTCTLDVPDGAGGVVTLTVQGLDRAAWADLIHQHPTTDPRHRWDPGALYPALVLRCVTDPVLDLATAAQMVDDPDIGTDLVDLCLRLTEPAGLDWARRRLDTDARLFAEVGAAVRMGIGHHQLTGWPIESQDLALAWIAIEAENKHRLTCPGCGVPRSDMTKPMAWEPDLLRCAHCDTLETARRGISEENRHREHIVLVPAGTD